MIKFLTDANVFVPIVEGLREMGHDVFDIKIDAFNALKLTDITGNLVIIDKRKTRVRKESIIE